MYVFGVILVRIQSECGEIRIRMTPNTDTFRIVEFTLFNLIYNSLCFTFSLFHVCSLAAPSAPKCPSRGQPPWRYSFFWQDGYRKPRDEMTSTSWDLNNQPFNCNLTTQPTVLRSSILFQQLFLFQSTKLFLKPEFVHRRQLAKLKI